MSEYRITTIEGGKAAITTPYNPEFVKRVKLLGGRWNGKQWVVPDSAVDAVRGAMQAVYGRTDEAPTETVTVVATATVEQHAYKSAYSLFGRTLATAWGRDSGARIGDGVAFVQGAPESGGSVKNWSTHIMAGSVIEIYDVPKAAYDAQMADLPSGWEVTTKGEAKLDLDALRAEKERLLARIAEIDKILG